MHEIKGINRSKEAKEKSKRKAKPSQRAKSAFMLMGLLYLFIVAIELIKKASLLLAPGLNRFLLYDMSPLKAAATGWFTTTIVQSSGIVSTITAAFTGSGILRFETAIYILMGALIGAAITALLISMITISVKRRDFRHGFEIGLCYSIYSTFLAIIVFALEFFFHVYSSLALFLASYIGENVSLGKVPDLIGVITNPVTGAFFSSFNGVALIFISLAMLIFSLRYIGMSVIGVFGGEDKARAFINRNFKSTIKAYFLGVFLTVIVFSSSITVSLLVPLATSRIINLKKAVPFIMGAGLGTTVDVFLAAVLIGKVNSIAVFFALALFGLTGALLFLPNTLFLWRTTKYVSKHIFHISRKTALYVLIGFILLPLLMIFVF